MIDPNRDEIVWAQSVRSFYDRKKAEGDEEPVLPEGYAQTMPGGAAIEELGKLGVKLSTYSLEGPTYLEAIPNSEGLEVQNG